MRPKTGNSSVNFIIDEAGRRGIEIISRLGSRDGGDAPRAAAGVLVRGASLGLLRRQLRSTTLHRCQEVSYRRCARSLTADERGRR
eukprot:2923168-Pleurochrysis_carterae.AAC.2